MFWNKKEKLKEEVIREEVVKDKKSLTVKGDVEGEDFIFYISKTSKRTISFILPECKLENIEVKKWELEDGLVSFMLKNKKDRIKIQEFTDRGYNRYSDGLEKDYHCIRFFDEKEKYKVVVEELEENK